MGFVFLTLILGGIFLDLRGDLQNTTTRAAAWQALGSFVALIPILMTIWVAMNSNIRAEKAEEEASELRVASIAQSAAMARLADASEKQAQLFHAEREQAQALQLKVANIPEYITRVGENGGQVVKVPSHQLVNFSLFPVLVEEVQLLSSRGGAANVYLKEPSQSVGGSGAMLSPGDRYVMNIGAARSVLKAQGQDSLEFTLQVTCLSPGQGRQTALFSVRFQAYGYDAEAEIVEFPSS